MGPIPLGKTVEFTVPLRFSAAFPIFLNYHT